MPLSAGLKFEKGASPRGCDAQTRRQHESKAEAITALHWRRELALAEKPAESPGRIIADPNHIYK
jgi:hypothetical protein